MRAQPEIGVPRCITALVHAVRFGRVYTEYRVRYVGAERVVRTINYRCHCHILVSRIHYFLPPDRRPFARASHTRSTMTQHTGRGRPRSYWSPLKLVIVADIYLPVMRVRYGVQCIYSRLGSPNVTIRSSTAEQTANMKFVSMHRRIAETR
uniref:Uncharacterized protein n=1 Tax=Sipha flava TaxID=143950 RepID=A0A2S2R647_9HEMI